MLTYAINSGFGRGPGGQGQFPNQSEWDQLIADFIAADPQVGAVVLEITNSTDLATLAERYDCFILSTNTVPGSDLSPLLNLDCIAGAERDAHLSPQHQRIAARIEWGRIAYADLNARLRAAQRLEIDLHGAVR